ncbi:MAG: metallophosphoesterase [Acidithiobacillus sp.]|nr:metallophosphoesterase [Acidithiobacillus sp.]
MRFLESNPPVFRHGANTAGRDFIVGDLHGCRAMLDGLLEHVVFDVQKDRLFSTGDLVDRGPDSEGCLALLEQPWFYPVLGNHDAMLMAWIIGESKDRRQRDYEYAFTHNDGWQWVNRFYKASQYLPLLERTPFIRVIGEGLHPARGCTATGGCTPARGETRFQVAHAELVDVASNVSVLTDAMLDHLSAQTWDREHYIVGYDDVGTWTDHVLWGRSLIHEVRSRARADQHLPLAVQRGLSRTYVGHSIVAPAFGGNGALPLEARSHVFLDSGAFSAEKNGTGLTLWNHTEHCGFFMDGIGHIHFLKGD